MCDKVKENDRKYRFSHVSEKETKIYIQLYKLENISFFNFSPLIFVA